MKKHLSFTVPLTRSETVYGICWMVISQLILPSILSAGNALLAQPISYGKLNFLYFALNFAAVVWIFRRFLSQSGKIALGRPFPVIWYAILGYLGSQVLLQFLSYLIFALSPEFSNANDQAVMDLLGQDRTLIAIGTVLLVPVAEEALYRGVVFRGLYDKSPLGAYLVSMFLFAAVHVISYIGVYSPLELVLALAQYLPYGYCLCWCYRQTGTIITPMLMHAMVNAMSIYYALR